ncbi:response regulator transcription factor [Labrys wisconsinensis]|uniref:Two-component system response regulator TctD n=1 Tax=Labrys wisconsinensis TaxID=425677 RepID=A0ABU0J517_9HYPH|nr:response regulator transcription factor [Labrys wisconsinensis]MDQ0468374.1 two-component system response regulator TctD [Labrys wisconsinensis]
MRILLVEDTEDLGQALFQHFLTEGHAVDWARTGPDAEAFLRAQAYDAILLDLGIPDLSGTELLKDLRRRRDTTPVLVMTARALMEDKLAHFELGADDYLLKPFDLRELDARLNALMRRLNGLAASSVRFGNFTFDGKARRAAIDGVPIELGRREFRLLEYFVSTRGRIASKEQIFDRLFGMEDEAGLNVVELYVSRLRRKLEGSRFTIRTIRGLGYVAEVEGE